MLQTVAYIVGRGARVLAIEGDASGNVPCRSYVTGVKNGALSFPPTAEGYLSLYAFGGAARGVTLEHLAYEMQDGELLPDVALGVSNAFIKGHAARVTVKNGLLLAIKPFS
jgi:thiamine pyrophosphokinase